MNRSLQAFAVLLVSLAGGMLAATWTSTLPVKRHYANTRAAARVEIGAQDRLQCSCNSDGVVRYEAGCARDKTTGELYGCGLGLGENAAHGKSVITVSFTRSVFSVVDLSRTLVHATRQPSWLQPGQELVGNMRAIADHLPKTLPEAMSEREATERDYAAAELAAAGFNPDRGLSSRFFQPFREIPKLISANKLLLVCRRLNSEIESLNRRAERQARLWLVMNGLHRQWDAAEEAQARPQLAGILYQYEEEHINRWFESFPRPITQPGRLLNPDVGPSDDSSEDSRKALLAAARALEAISQVLHGTAENLTRQAEQDVAELHKLKSRIEERR